MQQGRRRAVHTSSAVTLLQEAVIEILSYLSVQGVWSRALGLPIERPKSLTMEALEQKFGK